MADTLQSRLLSQLESRPDRHAIAFYSSDEPLTWLTYEQFLGRAASHADRLRDQGLNQGDVCMLVLPSDEHCATLVLAALLLGAVPLLIAPPVLQSDAAYSSLVEILNGVIVKTEPQVVVCPPRMREMRQKLEDLHPGSNFVFQGSEALSGHSAPIAIVRPSGEDIAAMQLTSGTTGFPRVCVWRQKQVIAGLDGMASAMGLGKDDICLNWTPLYHDMGLVNNLLLCLSSGIPLVLMEPTEFVKKPAIWLRGLSESGATVTWSPNFGFAISAQRVQDTEIEGIRLDKVRAFWSAAERIHLSTMTSFYDRFAPYGLRFAALKTNFGCAENVGGATFSDLNGSFVYEYVDRKHLYERGAVEPRSESELDYEGVTVVGVGRPYPDMIVSILSDDGEPLPDGTVGEIALVTPSRMEGYLDDEEATKRAIYGDYLRTGDLGYLRGGELYWVGRVSERITIRGRKLDPSDFERLLFEIEGLRTGCFVAFGVDEPDVGTQRVVLITEVRDSTTRTSDQISRDIRDQVLTGLGVTLSEIILVREGVLTKTSSGKRRHRHFQRLYLDGGLGTYEWRPNGK